MANVVRTFGKKTLRDIEHGGGTTCSASWESLLPYLEMIIKKKPTETIEGIVADERGVTIRLSTSSPQTPQK